MKNKKYNKNKTFLENVESESSRARSIKKKPINSVHEGYALILEEVDELWEQVRMKSDKRDYENMYIELVQIAGLSKRLVEDIVVPKIKEKNDSKTNR